MDLFKLSDEEYSLELTRHLQQFGKDDLIGINDKKIKISFHMMIAWSSFMTSDFTDIYIYIAYISIKKGKDKVLYFQLLMERMPTSDEKKLIDFYIDKIKNRQLIR